MKPGDRALEWQVWNCITDCCGDRDTCPDMDNEGEWADCLIQGDPHLKTFDSPVVNKNAYAPLDVYYLVDNEYITVQGRYGSTRSDNRASLMGVAVTGVLTGGVTIYIPKGYEHPPLIMVLRWREIDTTPQLSPSGMNTEVQTSTSSLTRPMDMERSVHCTSLFLKIPQMAPRLEEFVSTKLATGSLWLWLHM